MPAGAVGRSRGWRLAECDWAWLIREPPEIDVRRNLTRQRGLDTPHPGPDIHAPALLLLPPDNRERISNAPFIASAISFYFSPSRGCVFPRCTSQITTALASAKVSVERPSGSVPPSTLTRWISPPSAKARFSHQPSRLSYTRHAPTRLHHPRPPACSSPSRPTVQAALECRLNYSPSRWTAAAAASLAGAAQGSVPPSRSPLTTGTPTLTRTLSLTPSLRSCRRLSHSPLLSRAIRFQTRPARALPSPPPSLWLTGWHTRRPSEAAKPATPAP